jgi:hypothetical protein
MGGNKNEETVLKKDVTKNNEDTTTRPDGSVRTKRRSSRRPDRKIESTDQPSGRTAAERQARRERRRSQKNQSLNGENDITWHRNSGNPERSEATVKHDFEPSNGNSNLKQDAADDPSKTKEVSSRARPPTAPRRSSRPPKPPTPSSATTNEPAETFYWRREPLSPKRQALNKGNIKDVAKQIEKSNKREENAREAVATLRGRRMPNQRPRRASASPRRTSNSDVPSKPSSSRRSMSRERLSAEPKSERRSTSRSSLSRSDRARERTSQSERSSRTDNTGTEVDPIRRPPRKSSSFNQPKK